MLVSPDKIFVDTSASFALLDRADTNHIEASSLWALLMDNNITLVTSNYVVSDTMKLLQKRIGYEAAKVWYRDILSLMEILWIDENIHQKAYELWLTLGMIPINLVDCTSFVAMHHHNIEKVFCFKRHFKTYGFDLICCKDR
jgi:predicted nucleic acid-binding protein